MSQRGREGRGREGRERGEKREGEPIRNSNTARLETLARERFLVFL
jgi:hypothetical protein